MPRTKPTKVIIAELVTRSFTFQSAGRTEAEALSALEAAWAQHVSEYQDTPTFGIRGLHRPRMYTWDELRDDVNIMEVPFGGAVRDREIIIGGEA
jgi:hypothetical protein